MGINDQTDSRRRKQSARGSREETFLEGTAVENGD